MVGVTRRVVYLGRHLMLRSKYLDKVRNGRFTTIRLGIVRPRYREVFIHSGGMVIARARIVDIRYKRVGELTDEDARVDGFMSKDDLIRELRGIYGDVGIDDWVTILTLEVTRFIGVKDDGTEGLAPIDIARLALRYNAYYGDEERVILTTLISEGSVRRAAIKLFNSLDGRFVIRRVLNRVLKRLVRMGVIGNAGFRDLD
ncbi:ASCH domain-containing protein [Vulcanisaeta thermophila]|uniref:ASCH domain-containing protein n=1 Tax=Vulcanisaeta thermophila TaxID=867917 RepID=UPI000B199F1F|nr:ASCH domain-containing protein [Vulcanisaeta thermophila]